MDSTDSTIRPSRSGFSYVGTDEKGLYRAYINALASESKGKLLAAPHILVSDNREARIQVGQQVPIVTSETFGSTTVAPQRTIQYKDIGIILKVKPQVNDSGLISLDIAQEVSSYSTIELITNEKSIVVNKTEASTTLTVQDGETIIIGGLIREDNTNSDSGVPFLSKIPLLGFLFGNRSRDTSRQELIILLTPHVLKNQKEAKSITDEYIDNITSTDTTKGGIKKDELMKSGVQIRKGIGNGPDGTAPDKNMPPGGPQSP
jgi:general secretion pathway protein D